MLVRTGGSTHDQEVATLFPGQDVDLDAAKSWVRYQFDRMSALLEHVVSRLDSFDRARVLVDSEVSGDVLLNSTGHLYDQGESEELAREFLTALYQTGARTFIVEDELASKTNRPNDAFYVGEASLRSAAIGEDAASAVRLLRYGSGGYPCNALVCTSTEESLGLRSGADLTDDTIARIADSAVGLLTSVWDNESYVVLWREAQDA